MPASRRALRGAAGGQQLDAERGQGARQLEQAGLVGNGQQGAADGHGGRLDMVGTPEAEARDYSRGAQARPVDSRSFLRRVARLMPEHGGGAALVAVAVAQHFGEQRRFDLAQHDVVEVVRCRSRRGPAGNGARTVATWSRRAGCGWVRCGIRTRNACSEFTFREAPVVCDPLPCGRRSIQAGGQSTLPKSVAPASRSTSGKMP